jgi:hypothetical protein
MTAETLGFLNLGFLSRGLLRGHIFLHRDLTADEMRIQQFPARSGDLDGFYNLSVIEQRL